ncbi:DUF6192 family protein, partial [Streptomyces sp. NPDC026206]|uniref:DUF6192 family protein n=1 Tax=Streptomyces sp. NPDC026206 TaxID=3157089 RepID=UPI003401270B
MALSTVRNYRFAAHRWPEKQRRHGVSHKVHYVLAGIHDDAERFEAIGDPPLDERARVRRWTMDLAKKHVGQLPGRPETPAQKVAAIHRLAADDEVAAQVASDVLRRPAVAAKVVADDTARHMVNKAQTTQHKTEVVHDLIADDTVAAQVASDVLRRPEVAARVVADDTARHAVNRAQTDRSQQQADAFRQETPAGRAVRKICAISRGFASASIPRVDSVVPGQQGAKARPTRMDDDGPSGFPKNNRDLHGEARAGAAKSLVGPLPRDHRPAGTHGISHIIPATSNPALKQTVEECWTAGCGNDARHEHVHQAHPARGEHHPRGHRVRAAAVAGTLVDRWRTPSPPRPPARRWCCDHRFPHHARRP